MRDTTLEQIKTALRISDDAYDDQLLRLWEAAVLDMAASGVPVDDMDESDPRAVEAAVIYIKARFGNDPVEAARWQPIYDQYVAKMAIDEAARAEAGT